MWWQFENTALKCNISLGQRKEVVCQNRQRLQSWRWPPVTMAKDSSRGSKRSCPFLRINRPAAKEWKWTPSKAPQRLVNNSISEWREVLLGNYRKPCKMQQLKLDVIKSPQWPRGQLMLIYPLHWLRTHWISHFINTSCPACCLSAHSHLVRAHLAVKDMVICPAHGFMPNDGDPLLYTLYSRCKL